jgi:hypothetical protein
MQMFPIVDRIFANHEDHEGHEDRIKEITSKPKIYFFLRSLRALRDAIAFVFWLGLRSAKYFFTVDPEGP